MCHEPPVEGFEIHIITPSETTPKSNISAELCGSCHSGQHETTYNEWNEYSSDTFDPGTMASHSEPSNIEETEVINSSSCVSCKSTEGAILNIEDGELYDLSEDSMPEPEDINEWRITCVICHEPHSAELRTTSSTELCASCHNSGGAEPDGKTTVIRYTQWEMYNGSIYTNDAHAVKLGCTDCHMATMIEGNETTVTGHSLDLQPALLSDPNSGNICKKCHVVGHDDDDPADNECDDCHDIALSNIIATDQEAIKERLQDLELIEGNASDALALIDDNSSYQEQLENYNNALYHISKVESDGSFGIHNMERANDELDTAEILLNSVIEEGTRASNKERAATPGFGVLLSFVAITVTGLIFENRNNGKK